MTQIRPMSRDDVRRVAEIEWQVFPHDPWSAELFHQELDEVPATREVVVAIGDGEVVGYASLRFVGSEGDINTIAVAPDWQGRGIGRELLDWIFACAVQHGVGHLFLEVRSDNVTALGMYERRGFQRIDRRRNYYASDVDALVLRKRMAL
jgi:ribosomal-protein-alanine N-acetyltransferase